MLKGVSTWHLNSPEEFTKVQTRSKIWLPAVSWVFSPMATGSPGNETAAGSEPDCGSALPQALECQRDANRVVALLGGKTRIFRTWR